MGTSPTLPLDPQAAECYRGALSALHAAGLRFLVGGAYALGVYTGISRDTKDFDIFVMAGDVNDVLQALSKAGFHAEITHSHWLAKAFYGKHFIDVIFSSGNGAARVDEQWFEHGVPDEVLGMPVLVVPAEEIIWQKSFVHDRERYDGADIAHLLLARGESLDWERLVRRFGDNWRVLLAQLVLFGFAFPGERSRIPAEVMRSLLDRVAQELEAPPEDERICRGTLLSRQQYLVDVDQRGYRDARLEPLGSLTREQIDQWTAAIERP